MERLSDNAIEIVNELHTERLDYESEYVPIIDALNRLAEYEDIGLEPEKIVFLKNVVDDAFSDKPEFTEHIRELLRAEKDGRLVVLPYKVGDSFFAVRKFCDEHGELEEPAADVVSKGLYEQIKWERDVALTQLEEYGVSLGEKADVMKVRHGRWVNTHSDSEFAQCSLCKYPVYAAWIWNLTNYCPNCGAKMDL